MEIMECCPVSFKALGRISPHSPPIFSKLIQCKMNKFCSGAVLIAHTVHMFDKWGTALFLLTFLYSWFCCSSVWSCQFVPELYKCFLWIATLPFCFWGFLGICISSEVMIITFSLDFWHENMYAYILESILDLLCRSARITKMCNIQISTVWTVYIQM